MTHKLLPVAAAILVALTSYNVAAESATDVLTDGWEVNGYGSMNLRMVDGETVNSEFGKTNYHSAGTSGKSTNQVEFVIKKHTEHQNGAWSDFVVRTEYGNGNSFAYSSSGSQKDNTKAQLEVKESFVEIGGLSYLGEDTSIWGGQRFLNRSAGLLSGEFWNQSSGVGAGIQTKLGGNTAGFAFLVADTSDDINADVNKDRQTLSSYNFYYHGVEALGGSFNFDLKYMEQANQEDELSGGIKSAEDGIGGAITYNRDYYGLDGWTQTGIAYGKGIAANRGVNFGDWSGAFSEDSTGLFITSYGVLNISENLQLGTEFVYFSNDDSFGQKSLDRMMFAARPSYKINDNLRLELTGSVSSEKLDDGVAWGRKDDNTYYMIEAASVFTVNADYFGRPQIKPYVTYYSTEQGSGGGLEFSDSTKDSEVVVGVHTEIWF
ncbi:carbohydrate porin [Moritella sp. Urea-trap-13]|uniref:carbohydrate porin n=1 Tax=Moritella sp. Urea-trap-13 TaxID=2058327 RepID=UPI000C330ED1|nr:carbohydrate porin [Moritella sp. Urea-trap-13]PKH09340.1 maltoporin [Moritella sp. Urea-trap-13]